MLLKRVVSALIGGGLLLYLVYRGGIFLMLGTVVLVLVALKEMFNMGEIVHLRAWQNSGYLAGLIMVIGAYVEQGRFLPMLLTLWLMYCMAFFMIRFHDVSLQELAFNFFSVVYVAFLFSHMLLLRNLTHGVYVTFLALGLTWATDTGAYFVGRAFGRHKLAARISPNKTVEGAVGGLFFAVVISLLVSRLLPVRSIGLEMMGILGLAVGVTAQIGDLVESAIKRFAGVKDSGQVIPGHGGVLDRIDSWLFTIPIVYYLLMGLIIN